MGQMAKDTAKNVREGIRKVEIALNSMNWMCRNR